MDLTLKRVKWQKGTDFISNSTTYSFDNRFPDITDADIGVLIYSEKEFINENYGEKKTYFYGYVVNRAKETSDTVGRFKTLKEAKLETLKLFNEYMGLFAEDEIWYRNLRLSLHPGKYKDDGMTLKT